MHLGWIKRLRLPTSGRVPRATRVWLAAGAAAIAAAPLVRAHELQPALLELTQTGPSSYEVVWETPPGRDLREVRPAFPPECRVTSAVIRGVDRASYVERYAVECPGGLAGKTISMQGSLAPLFDLLVRIVRPDGTSQIARITPDQPSVVVEAKPGVAGRAATFVRLGLEHILRGLDHLLFVLGLLWIVRDRMMLLKTITAFTVAHSLTLGIATLGWANAPTLPLNAAIALSILFLGPEMVRAQRGQTSAAIAHPWVVAFAFGLLHGFGFASGLTALGLTRGEIPLALLLFNLGVEAGQLLFVALILLLAASCRVLQVRWSRWAAWVPPYLVGSLGAYWTLQRTVLLFSPAQ
jgi:hypothetical protein